MPIAVAETTTTDDYIAALVAAAPPLTAETLERVAALFRAGSK